MEHTDKPTHIHGLARVPEDSDSVVPKWRVNLTLAVCFLECLIFGGTVYGWAVLAFVFKADGVYLNACDEKYINASAKPGDRNPTLISMNETNMKYSRVHITGSADPWRNQVNETQSIYNGTYDMIDFSGCAAQESHYSLAYTLTVVLMGVFAFPVGWLFDHFGIMVTKIAATFLCVPAIIMLATCDGELSWMLYPALPMLGITNIMIMVTNNHASTIAGKKTSTMIGLNSGGVSASGIVFILVKLAHDSGISRFASLLTLAACWSLVAISTFALLPRFKVTQKHLPKTPKLEGTNNNDVPVEEVAMLTKANEGSQITPDTNGKLISADLKDTPDVSYSPTPEERYGILKIVCSVYLLSHVIWFSLLHLRFMSFIGSFITWTNSLSSISLNQVNMACDIFGYSQLICIVASPVIGIFMDRKRRYLIAHKITGRQRAVATVTSLLLGSAFMTLLSICILIPARWVPLVAPAWSHFARSFIYPSAFAYLDFVFPKEHFGKLVGIMYFIGGAVGFLQHALFKWAETSGFLQPNIALLLLSLATFAHPITILILHKNKNNSN